ncbi:AAA family ATPase [Siminovitchia fortis]|uniref:AAA family ATPase n=1 Tax=Siminovitchia fortis TaxID=254758 RepID=UPI0011A56DE8|nr:AAA family ATPase [Siminovitchia fortis]
MKLKQLHIYGYGRLHDFKVDNLSDLQLFYGENEAGKSTIMSFIHSILFGFPTLKQSELRYEPKTHSSYGGKLIFETEKFGEVLIERVKGKAAGNVTVLLEDGPAEASDFLPKLLNGTDKKMFRSIFSFDLQDLQEIQRLKEEEIGKYLIAAGSIGTDGILKSEQQLQRELQELFKPGGRKPLLNDLLKKLRLQEQHLKKAKHENALYESLLTEMRELESRVEAAKELLKEKKAEFDDVNELLKKWPLIMEKGQIKKRLFELEPVEFPADGIKRLEKYNDRLLELSSTLQTLRQRMKSIESEMEENALRQEVDLDKAEMFVNEWAKQQQSLRELSGLEHSIAEARKQYDSFLAELHYPAEKAGNIKNLNLGMDMKARMKETLQQYIRYESRLNDLADRLEDDRKAVIELENRCKEIEEQFVSESTFKEWKTRLGHESAASIEREKSQLEREIEELDKRKKHEKDRLQKKKRQAFIFSSAFLFIFLGVFIWSFISKQWPLTLAAVSAMIFAGYFLVRKADGNAIDFINETLEDKRRRLQDLDQQLKTADGDIHIAYRYEEQQRLREKWKEDFARLEEQKQRLEESENSFKRLSEVVQTKESKLNEIKAELGLAKDFFHLKIEDAFSVLKNLQGIESGLNDAMEKRELLQKEQEAWADNLFQFLGNIGASIHEPSQAIFFLQEMLKKEREKKIVLKELKKKLSELNANVLQLENEESAIRSNMKKLFESAHVDNEDDFRKIAKLSEEKNTLLARLDLLEGQLGDVTSRFQTREEIQNEINHLNEVIEKESRHLEEDRDRLASLKQKISFLEEGGTYTEQLHLFRQMRSTFNEEARKWAELAVASSLLEKVMQTYKEGRFPQVIQKAAEYFSFLTGHEYKQLHVKADGSLAVERKDRILFAPEELSKGTGEQLYIAIRLGLVHVLKKEYPFPVIIDDGFVNFDEMRTKRILELIQTISSDTQVLLFTCHRHIAGQFSEDRIIQIRQRLPQAALAE